MTTQIKPENQDQNNEPNTSPPISQSPETPPTPPPAPSPTNKASDETYLAVIREQNARIEKMQQQLTETNNQRNQPPAKSAEELNQEFYKDPVGVLDSRINAALERTIAPLQEVAKMFKATNRTDELINQFKSDPRFSGKWNSKLEQYVRQQAATLDPNNLNENTIGIIVVNGFGMQSIGMLESDTPSSPPPASPNNNPKPKQDNTMIPPYMPPSANLPDNSNQPGGKRTRELNEFEARLAREKGLTKEQYLEWLELPGSAVASSNIGKPQPPVGGR